MHWFAAIISTLFIGGAEFVLIALLEHLTGVSLFDCFDKDCWRDKPSAMTLKAIVMLFAVALLVVSFIAVLNGDGAFGDIAGSEQWEPAW